MVLQIVKIGLQNIKMFITSLEWYSVADIFICNTELDSIKTTYIGKLAHNVTIENASTYGKNTVKEAYVRYLRYDLIWHNT